MAAHKNTPDSFWRKIKIGGPYECWPWLAGRSHKGYGKVKWHGVDYRAHQIAHALATGTFPVRDHRKGAKDKICILHSCDNPPCCNPSHLRPGTSLDNATDRDLRDRTSKGDQHFSRLLPGLLARGDSSGSRLHPEKLCRGSAQHDAKLTEADIPVIRARLATGDTLRITAEAFGVSIPTIWRIKMGRAWRHA